MKLYGKYGEIRAMYAGVILAVVDWISVFLILKYMAHKTTSSLKLEYADGQKKQISKDIRHGAFFMTNHRDIVMDAAWLSMLLRSRYGIRPFMGIGNNLFGKWWIEAVVRFLRCFVVIRNGGPREQLKNSKLLSSYIRHLRAQKHSIWLAQREGRAKDGNDLTQPAVLKMLTLGEDDFLETIYTFNICPVSISYEYDPCDFLKAREMQLKRDNEHWRKSKQDDLISMSTGINGWKGEVVFRLTPSINHWIDCHRTELEHMTRNEQIQAVAHQIDHQIHYNYQIYNRGKEFEEYLDSRIQKIKISNKDQAFLKDKLLEMYNYPVQNYMTAHNMAQA